MKHIKKVYIAVFSIIIYFILSYIYSNMIKKEEYIDVYVLNSEYSKGTSIKKENIQKVQIKNAKKEDKYYEYDINEIYEKIDSYVLNYDFKAGKILESSDFILKDEYLKQGNLNEYIIIKINNSTDNLTANIKKGSIVNIYYTGIEEKIRDVLNKLSFETVISSTRQDAYITTKVFENVLVIEAYNKEGKTIDNSNTNEQDMVNSILIKAKKEDILIVKNLEKYGEYSVSIINN